MHKAVPTSLQLFSCQWNYILWHNRSVKVIPQSAASPCPCSAAIVLVSNNGVSATASHDVLIDCIAAAAAAAAQFVISFVSRAH